MDAHMSTAQLVSLVVLVLCLTTPDGGGKTHTFEQDRTELRAAVEQSSGTDERVHWSSDSLRVLGVGKKHLAIFAYSAVVFLCALESVEVNVVTLQSSRLC